MFLNPVSVNPFIVKYVDFTTTRLVGADNSYHPAVSMSDAKRMAQEAGLDLVCFNRPEKDVLALCKIINFGKWKYSSEKQKKKQSKEGKKDTKEIRLSPDIDEHDVGHKIKHAKEFLIDGNDVLFFMKLKGRQRVYFKEAEEKMNKIVSMCLDCGEELSRRKSPNSIAIRVGNSKQVNNKDLACLKI